MKHGIVADKSAPAEVDGVIHAEFHDAVDGFGLGDAFLKREDGFSDHRA